MPTIIILALLVATASVRHSLRIKSFTRKDFHLKLTAADDVDSSSIPQLASEPPLKILLLVEPTPFNYVSGYANRFKEMLKFLHAAGDEVRILTADKDPKPPLEFMGYPITTNRGFEFILYNQVTLTFDFKRETERLIKEFKPDLIHVSSPSSIIWPAILWSRIYNIPLVMSYHTNFAEYSRTYGGFPGAVYLSYKVLRFFHNQADLTLCTSPQLAEDLESCGVRRIDVWQKGINAERFSPSFRSDEMRHRLSDGDVDAPLLIYVGRIGAEKKLHRLKKVLDANPGARLAFVGKGPMDDEMKKLFQGYPVHFAGQLIDDELSAAFASADLFVMPSDSETLGFVVLEAMASGIPVVGVAAGGLVDIIQNEKTGYLVSNSEDMVEFSKMTKELIENKERRIEFGAAARSWSMQWSWEAATSKLRNIQYRRAIKLHKSRCVVSNDHFKDIEHVLLERANTYRPDLA